MITTLEERLGAEAIARLSSPYIDRGVKEDAWEITEIEISDRTLRARVRMTSRFVSPTDPGGFHLTVFATLEFLAQLCNIYLHRLAGYERKCRETWMRECSVTCRSSIRDPEAIQVEMDFRVLRWAGETLAGKVDCRVTDPGGGLFTARLTGFMG